MIDTLLMAASWVIIAAGGVISTILVGASVVVLVAWMVEALS